MSDYYLGQIIENEYETSAAGFCNSNNATIKTIGTVEKKVEKHIVENKQSFAVFTDGSRIKLWPYNKDIYKVGATVAVRRYQIVENPPKSTEQLAMEVRATRNAKISETDCLMMSDYPISAEDKTLVEAYRQALRDIPQQEGFPSEVQWPVVPQCVK